MAIEPFTAMIAMDRSTAAVTVRPRVFEVMPSMVALIFELPMPAPVAKPPAAMATTVDEAEFQVTWLVMLAVLASL